MKIKTMLLLTTGAIFLASGAFLAGRLFNLEGNLFSGSIFSADGINEMMSAEIEMTPAAEVPGLPQIANGIFLSRTDNSIAILEFVGNTFGGNSQEVVSVPLDDGTTITGAGNGTKNTDILITSQTKIYKDLTDYQEAIDKGLKSLQQVMTEGNIDELNRLSHLRVWGRKNGERVIADTIIYSNPMTIESDSTHTDK
jgi:hypothetical protein